MILKSLGGWEPCLELNYSLSKRRGESDRQDMCAVIQVNWRMTSKCRFLLDVRDGAPSCDCWQVALSRWQCGAWGQGSRGSRGALRGTEGHWGALRGALGHRREGPLCAHPRWEPAHAATKLQSEHSTTQVKTLNMEKCFPTLGYF